MVCSRLAQKSIAIVRSCISTGTWISFFAKNTLSLIHISSDGLTRPEGATGNYFKWLGSDGKLYAPGASVPADVTTLTARFVPDTYTVIVTTDTLPEGKTGKAYSHTPVSYTHLFFAEK